MIYPFAILLFLSSLVAGDLEYKGDIGIEGDYFSHDIDGKREASAALRSEFEIKKNLRKAKLKLKAKAIYDFKDSERRYIDFSELYYKYDFEDSELLIGKNTLFWGALEVYNIVDVFNTKDLLDDPFDYDKKLGAWNLSWTKFFENSEFSMMLKFKEEDQKIQDKESVYNFLPFPYDNDLKTQYDNRPSIFLRYAGFGDEMQIDYAFIYEAGYDSQRYFSYKEGRLYQNAYWVNKLMAYATLVYEDTIYKAEAALAASDDVKVSDYLQSGLGLERTLYGIWDKKDLGLLVEYYRYDRFNDTKLSVKELGQLFQNDLYFGGRLTFNDLASSEILAGVDIDLESSEKIYFFKYETRLYESYKVQLHYQHLNADNEESYFDDLDHLKLAVSYYF